MGGVLEGGNVASVDPAGPSRREPCTEQAHKIARAITRVPSVITRRLGMHNRNRSEADKLVHFGKT